MCKYHLQSFIGLISDLDFSIFGYELKVVPLFFLIIFGILVLLFFKRINLFKMLSLLAVFFIVYLGQNIADFYLGHSLHDIQNNWHYIAYAIFSYLMYRFLKSKNVKPAKIILISFFAAALISTSDEAFQLNMTNRVFDLGDIGKDVLGSIIGLIIVFFILENGSLVRNGWHLRQKKISDYLRNPLSVLFQELIFVIIFLSVSSILTGTSFRLNAIIISFALYGIFFVIFHLTRYKITKFILAGLLLIQLVSFAIFSSRNIVYNANNLVIYKGIPIPYFDVMIFDNGTFRLVDKKSFFQYVDLYTIKKYATDILLLGSGETGKGGNGLATKEKMQFVVNKNINDLTQILILKNRNAVTLFNNLKKQNKKVTFILHHE